MSAYHVQVWLHCEEPGCDQMIDMMIRFDLAVYSHVTDRPPGWTHKGYATASSDFECYGGSALCPKHSPPDDGRPRCRCGGPL